MALSKDTLLEYIRSGKELSLGQRIRLCLMLSYPAILAQLSSVMMQYIDSSMVGHLGPEAGASIGLVSTCLWLFGGFGMAVTSGFSVQVAHRIGAGDFAGLFSARLLCAEWLSPFCCPLWESPFPEVFLTGLADRLTLPATPESTSL